MITNLEFMSVKMKLGHLMPRGHKVFLNSLNSIKRGGFSTYVASFQFTSKLSAVQYPEVMSNNSSNAFARRVAEKLERPPSAEWCFGDVYIFSASALDSRTSHYFNVSEYSGTTKY